MLSIYGFKGNVFVMFETKTPSFFCVEYLQMAQFLNKILQTTRGTKAHLLVFGYIRNETAPSKLDTIFPDVIVMECLKYYFETPAWDPNAYPPDLMKLTAHNSTIKMLKTSYASAYISDVIDSGIHEYTFQILRGLHESWHQTIGIWSINGSGDPPLTDDFLLKGNSLGLTNTGMEWGFFKYCPGYTTGDIVVMTVDFETEELRFKINSTDYGKMTRINPNYKYRAAVSLWDEGDAIKIL